MTEKNLILLAATYPDAAAAQSDYEALKAAESGDYVVDNAVIMSRDAEGKVTVDEGGVTATAGGAVVGGAAGLVVGLFAPPLLLATAVGAGIGAIAGELTKKHQEKKLGMDLEEVMPPGTSALVVIVDDQYADRVDKALDKATKKVNKAIDSDDYDELSKALSEGDKGIEDALNS